MFVAFSLPLLRLLTAPTTPFHCPSNALVTPLYVIPRPYHVPSPPTTRRLHAAHAPALSSIGRCPSCGNKHAAKIVVQYTTAVEPCTMHELHFPFNAQSSLYSNQTPNTHYVFTPVSDLKTVDSLNTVTSKICYLLLFKAINNLFSKSLYVYQRLFVISREK